MKNKNTKKYQSSSRKDRELKAIGIEPSKELKFDKGGVKKYQSGSSNPPTDAEKEYFDFKKYLERARQAIGTNNKEELKALSLKPGKPYNSNDLIDDYHTAQDLRKKAGLGMGEEADLVYPHAGQMIRGTVNKMLGTNFRRGGKKR